MPDGTGTPGGKEPQPTDAGLGSPGFGWGTDPKTGAYRYGELGANGFLVPGSGEIPPNDPQASHTTGNIAVAGRGGSGVGAVIAAVVIVCFVVIGIFVAVSIARISHTIGTVFDGNCVGTPQIGGTALPTDGGEIRVRCSGGGSVVLPGAFVGPNVSASPHKHHHHNGGR